MFLGCPSIRPVEILVRAISQERLNEGFMWSYYCNQQVIRFAFRFEIKARSNV